MKILAGFPSMVDIHHNLEVLGSTWSTLGMMQGLQALRCLVTRSSPIAVDLHGWTPADKRIKLQAEFDLSKARSWRLELQQSITSQGLSIFFTVENSLRTLERSDHQVPRTLICLRRRTLLNNFGILKRLLQLPTAVCWLALSPTL